MVFKKIMFSFKDIIREVRNDKKALMSAGIAQSAEEIKEELMREIPPPAKHQYVQEIRDSVNQCKSLVDDFLFRVMQEDKTVRTQTPILPFLINSTEMRKKRLEIQERAKENAAAAGQLTNSDQIIKFWFSSKCIHARKRQRYKQLRLRKVPRRAWVSAYHQNPKNNQSRAEYKNDSAKAAEGAAKYYEFKRASKSRK